MSKERKYLPEEHQKLCQETLIKMIKNCVVNFVIRESSNNITSLVPKGPHPRLLFMAFSKSPETSLDQYQDGPWLYKTPNITVERLVHLLPSLFNKCFPDQATQIRQYRISTDHHKPPIININVDQIC